MSCQHKYNFAHQKATLLSRPKSLARESSFGPSPVWQQDSRAGNDGPVKPSQPSANGCSLAVWRPWRDACQCRLAAAFFFRPFRGNFVVPHGLQVLVRQMLARDRLRFRIGREGMMGEEMWSYLTDVTGLLFFQLYVFRGKIGSLIKERFGKYFIILNLVARIFNKI